MTGRKDDQWLVCYDIRDHRRLTHVFKYLKKHGVPIQYSVFLVDASTKKMGNMLQDLEKLMDTKKDDIRAYGLPNSPQFDTIGLSILPLGTMPTLTLQ